MPAGSEFKDATGSDFRHITAGIDPAGDLKMSVCQPGQQVGKRGMDLVLKHVELLPTAIRCGSASVAQIRPIFSSLRADD